MEQIHGFLFSLYSKAMSMESDKRQEQIVALLLNHDTMKVSELSDRLHVTPETIRKDLNALEKRGYVTRSHGSASILNSTNFEQPMIYRMQENPEIKKKISQAAFPYIKDGMMIYICASTSNLYLARLLRIRRNLTVYTNSLDVLELAGDSGNRIILLGGELSPAGRRTVGMYVLENLKGLHFDISFIGMDGCKNLNGPGYLDYEDAKTESLCALHSRFTVLMSDASKFDKYAGYQYAEFSDINLLITSRMKKEDKERTGISNIIEVS